MAEMDEEPAMIAFVTVLLHFGASYLHGLLSYRFFPQRHQNNSIYIFWSCMVLWTVLHALYGAALLCEALESTNSLYFLLVFASYLLLPLVSALLIPIFLGELTVSPSGPGKLARLLLKVSNNIWAIFYGIVFICLVYAGWNVFHVLPLEQWGGQYGNVFALYGLMAIGVLWLLMLLSGIRPEKKYWREAGNSLRLVFAVMVITNGSIYFLGDVEYWSWIPLSNTLLFSLVFSWYRFRLQFMDMILNQMVRIIMLVAAVLGLAQLISSQLYIAFVQYQYFLLMVYVLLTLGVYYLVSMTFHRLWVPAESILTTLHTSLPVKLAKCNSEADAILATEQFIAQTFRCSVAINRTPDFAGGELLSLPGEVPLELKLGHIHGWIPWLSQAKSWAKTAGMYLQSHLLMENNYKHSIETKELAALAARAELNALRAQIKPHFLFNTLNSIHSYVRDDPAQAERVIEQLSELMRSILTSPDTDTIPLEKELATVNNYLAIEKSRYGDRLDYQMDGEKECYGVLVPPFSVQPLVENVVKHAVDGQFEPVNLTINLMKSETHLIIRVSDDGPGLSGTNDGLGLATQNIRERLSRLYGDVACLAIYQNEPKGVTAKLSIPLSASRASIMNE